MKVAIKTELIPSPAARGRGRRVRALVLALIPTFSRLAAGEGDNNLSKGVAAFEERRWPEAMEAFLDVLKQDPANPQAHTYVVLVTREMEAERQAIVRRHRLQMLGDASRHLEGQRHDAAPLEQAIIDTAQSEKIAQEEKWRSRCEEARLERLAGHLLSANDMILQVLAENGSFSEAQRELSELQSQIRQTLDAGMNTSIRERYAMEGFYAYGQADYVTALAAWGKARPGAACRRAAWTATGDRQPEPP